MEFYGSAMGFSLNWQIISFSLKNSTLTFGQKVKNSMKK